MKNPISDMKESLKTCKDIYLANFLIETIQMIEDAVKYQHYVDYTNRKEMQEFLKGVPFFKDADTQYASDKQLKEWCELAMPEHCLKMLEHKHKHDEERSMGLE